jgi:AcrR family transcriptional regulator
MIKDKIRTFSNDSQLVTLRREKIAECAMSIIIKKGFDRTNVREIARKSGMALGTLYHYVGTKEDILYLVVNIGLSKYQEFYACLLADIEILSPTDALRKAIDRYYRIVDKYQDQMALGYREMRFLKPRDRQAVWEIDQRILRLFENLLTKGCETGEFHIDNVSMFAHTIVVIGQMWAVRRWFLSKCCTLEEYIREHSEFIIDGISKVKVGGAKNCVSRKL